MAGITANLTDFKELNENIRQTDDKCVIIDNCIGQRFIADGLSDKKIVINGVPGNALGAYLNGAEIEVFGNVQEATGDTMNDGVITVHGNAGDATGYAMRGGKIFIEKNAGYRAGIHMKAYKEKFPALIIGGEAGSFLGEYQAGGVIVVLGLYTSGKPPVGYFCGTGMHGGKIFLRTESIPHDLPAQVSSKKAEKEDLEEIKDYIKEFCEKFSKDEEEILSGTFYVLTPNTNNPYKQLYTSN